MFGIPSVQDKISETTSSLSTKTDDLWNLFTHGAKQYIDKETRADDVYMPGVEDQYYATGSQQMAGGGYGGGMSPAAIGLLVGGGLLALIVLKKAKVF